MSIGHEHEPAYYPSWYVFAPVLFSSLDLRLGASSSQKIFDICIYIYIIIFVNRNSKRTTHQLKREGKENLRLNQYKR